MVKIYAIIGGRELARSVDFDISSGHKFFFFYFFIFLNKVTFFLG